MSAMKCSCWSPCDGLQQPLLRNRVAPHACRIGVDMDAIVDGRFVLEFGEQNVWVSILPAREIVNVAVMRLCDDPPFRIDTFFAPRLVIVLLTSFSKYRGTWSI